MDLATLVFHQLAMLVPLKGIYNKPYQQPTQAVLS